MTKFDKKNKNLTEEAIELYKRGQLKSSLGTKAKNRDQAAAMDIEVARKKGVQISPVAPKNKPTKKG